ncbi:PHD finger protein 7-like [Tyto alba]|uniref:PHD finger protein 7-like n=1 Tax=Tyto alba TaxID=56313 RepID=UPI001C670E1E|nr:PHD finger protein 7-like [Tyto alba]
MSARKQEAANSIDLGESKASLPQHSRGAVGALSVGLRAVAGAGRSSPSALGQCPSVPQPAGPRLGRGHLLLGHPCLQGQPSGPLVPGPAEVSCSFPLSFALSPPACMLCGRAEADPHICGKKLQKQGICAHLFCLFFTKKLFNQESMDGVSLKDIRRTIKQASQRRCFVCGESGAAITCCQEGCDRSFHLPCAVEGECITQYFGLYRSFCWQHRPEQAVEAAPGENTACLICLDPVEDRKSYGTLVCPACKHAWFHRACIQNQAIYAGFFCFQCPHCQNEYRFLMEMLTMGIRIPKRIPSGEDDSAYEELYERHSRCDARECLCPGGRQHAEEQGPWQLLLCCSCAAEGTHRRCSFMKHSTVIWECDSCAGLGTASSGSSEVTGPITESQSRSGPSHSSPAPETSSPSSTGLQAPSGLSHGSPVLVGRSWCRPPGPDRLRDRSRSRCRAQKPYSRRTRGRGRSRAPAPRAESSSPAQSVPGCSRGSPVPETGSPSTPSSARLQSSRRPSRPGPVRGRDRFPLTTSGPEPLQPARTLTRDQPCAGPACWP